MSGWAYSSPAPPPNVSPFPRLTGDWGRLRRRSGSVQGKKQGVGGADGEPSALPRCRCTGHRTELLSHIALDRFRYFLALFAEFFAPVDHSTCAPSDLGPYSTLLGAHRAIQASFPRRSTCRCAEDADRDCWWIALRNRAITRICWPFQDRSLPPAITDRASTPHFLQRRSIEPLTAHGMISREGTTQCAASSLAVTKAITVDFSSSADWYA
jgi:hypothetical protein